MDQDENTQPARELMAVLSQGAVGMSTVQGIELGFFDWIPLTHPITAEAISGQLGYDITRVERWLRFAAVTGLIERSEEGYTLTAKGALLRRGTPVPDLLGLHHMFSFFTKAVLHSRNAYQKGIGLDSIATGLIGRDYIPRVTSPLAQAATAFFMRTGLSPGHTVLDLGCGDGSALRELIRICPGVSGAGIERNIHALTLGIRRNAETGLQDQVDLQGGDVTDLSRFPEGSFDWVFAFNLFPFLPAHRRTSLVQDMVRISRYGIFFDQVILNSVQTVSVDVLLSTLFTDYTGFFTEREADELIGHTGLRHHTITPLVHGESRLVAAYTSQNDVPVVRIPHLPLTAGERLTAAGIRTAKELLTAAPEALQALGIDAASLRRTVVKTLFP